MRAHRAYALALVLQVLGAGGALLLGGAHWQTITTSRPRPLGDDVVQASGRTVDGLPTALALVALAGVVAVLATRGWWRRGVGALVGLAGVALVVRAVVDAGPVGTVQARRIVSASHPTTSVTGLVPHVATHPAWPVLTAVCGVLVLAAGASLAARGHHWGAMSARYEAAPVQAEEAEEDPNKAARTLWTALDRGEDPTVLAAGAAAHGETAGRADDVSAAASREGAADPDRDGGHRPR